MDSDIDIMQQILDSKSSDEWQNAAQNKIAAIEVPDAMREVMNNTTPEEIQSSATDRIADYEVFPDEDNTTSTFEAEIPSQKWVDYERKEFEDLGFRFEPEPERELVYSRSINQLGNTGTLFESNFDEEEAEFLKGYIRQSDDFNLAAEVARGKLGTALVLTQGLDPDKEARLNEVGEILQQPREVVENDPKTAESLVKHKEDIAYLQSIVSPEALNWFSNSQNFAVAKGDMALKKLDSIYTSYNGNIFERAWYNLGEGWTGVKQGALGSYLSVIEGGSDLFKKTLGGVHESLVNLRVDSPELFAADLSDLDGRKRERELIQQAIDSKGIEEWQEIAKERIANTEVSAELKALVENSTQHDVENIIKEAVENNAITSGDVKIFEQVKNEVKQEVNQKLYQQSVETKAELKERLLKDFYSKQIGDEVRADLAKAENTPVSLLDAGWFDHIVSMTPLMAFGITASVFTGGVGGALIFGQQAQGGSYLELTDSGISPMMSLFGSSTIGAAEGGLEYLTFQSFGRIAKAFGLAGTNKIGWFDATTNIVKEQGKEYLQEYAQSVSSEGQLAAYKWILADGYDLHNAVEDFTENGLVGGSEEALLVLPFGLLGGGAYVVNYAGRAKASKQAFDYYVEHMDAVGQSELRKRSPSKFKNYLQNIMTGAMRRFKADKLKESQKSEVLSDDNPEKVLEDGKEAYKSEQGESYNQSFYLRADKAKEILEEHHKDTAKVNEFLEKIGVDPECFEVCAKSKAYISVDAVEWSSNAAKTTEEELLRNHIRVDQNIASMDEIFVEGQEASVIREKIEVASKRLRDIKDNYEKINRNHKSSLMRAGFKASSAESLLDVSKKMFSMIAMQEGKDISDVAARVRFDSEGKAYYRPRININKIQSVKPVEVNAGENVRQETNAEPTSNQPKPHAKHFPSYVDRNSEVGAELLGRADGLGKNAFDALAGITGNDNPKAYIVNNIENILNALIKDKVLEEDEISVLYDSESMGVNVSLVQNLFLGNIIPDINRLSGMAGGLKDKLSVLVPQLMSGSHNVDWDLRSIIYKATSYIGGKNSYAIDNNLTGSDNKQQWEKYINSLGIDNSNAAIEVAKWLDGNDAAKLRSDLAQYNIRIPDIENINNELFDKPLQTRSQVLSNILGVEVDINGENYNQAKINEDNDKRYQKQLTETVFKNKPLDHTIKVIQTPKVLKALGVKDLPITITARVINKAKNTKHNITYGQFADLPNQLREPLMIFKSQSRANSMVVLTEHVDTDGLPVIVALHLNTKEKRHQVNRIASIYGLSGSEYKFQDWIDNDSLLYVDNEKSSELIQSRGLQLPKEVEVQSKDNNSDSLQSRGLQLPKEGANKSYKTRSDIFNIPDESDNVKNNIDDEFDTMQQQNRGRIVFDGMNAVISLMESSESSTVLHEMMHWYSVNARTIIENGMGSEQFKNDYKALQDYADLTEDESKNLSSQELGESFGYDKDTWAAMNDTDRTRIIKEEKVAQAFEKYIMEGKAPAPSLMKTFEHLKRLLKNVYKYIRLERELTEEVREVFDRIFATDDEMEEMRRFHREYEELAGVVLKSEESLHKFFEMTNKQRDRETVHATKAFFTIMKETGIEDIYRMAKKQVEAEPVYQAVMQIKQDGGISEQTFKLLTGESSKYYFKKGNHGIIIDKGSADINAIALEKGFDSADELFKELKNRVEIIKAISIRQDELRAKYQREFAEIEAGKKLSTDNPYYNDDELEKLAYLYNSIQEEIANANSDSASRGLSNHEISIKAIKEHVKVEFDKYLGRNLTSIQAFMTADEKAGKELRSAMKAGNQVRTMACAKTKMYTHARLQQAVRGNELIRRFDQNYKTRNLQSTLSNKNIKYEFAEVIKDIVTFYKVTKSGRLQPNVSGDVLMLPEMNVGVEGFETEHLGESFGLGEYFNETGSEIIPDWLFNKELPEDYKNFKDLTIVQIQELNNAIEFLLKQGRNNLKTLKTDKFSDINEYVTELVGTMGELDNKNHSSIEDGKIRHKLSKFIENINSRNKMMEYLFDEVDNFSFMTSGKPGLMGETFAKLVQCETNIKEAQEGIFKQLEPFLNDLAGARDRWEKIHNSKFGDIAGFPFPEIFKEKNSGRTQFDFDMVLAFAFNIGNDANEWSLIQGYRLGQKEFEKWCEQFAINYLGDLTNKVNSFRKDAEIFEKQATTFYEAGDSGRAYEARSQARECNYQADRIEAEFDVLKELQSADKNMFIQRVGMQEIEQFREMRLQCGRAYTNKIANFFLDKEWDAIQGVWDTLDVLYDPLVDVTYNLHNMKPKKEEAVPFVVKTADNVSKTVRGGYFPLIYDPALHDKTADQNAHADAMKGSKANSKKVNVNAGAKTDRVRGQWFFEAVVERPPLLSAQSVLLRHINETTRYIHLAETLTDFDLITKDKLFKDTFIKKCGHDMYEQLRKFVEDLASPDKDIPKGWDELLDKTRKLNCVWTLGLNIGTGLKQRLSGFNAVFALSKYIGRNEALRFYYQGVKYCGKDNVSIGLTNQNIQKLLSLSDYLKARQGEFDINVRDMVKEFNPLGNRKTMNINGTEVGLKELQDWAFKWIQMNDQATIFTIWKGAYDAAMEKNLGGVSNLKTPMENEKLAVLFADKILRTTQPSTLNTDLSELQRNKKGLLHFFAVFKTFTLKATNLFTHHYKAYQEGHISGAQLSEMFIMNFVLPRWSVLVAEGLIGGLLLGDDDEIQFWKFGVLPFADTVAGVPILSDAISSVTSGYDVKVGAVDKFKLIQNPIKHTLNGDFGIAVWDFAKLAGFASGVPVKNIYKNGKFVHDIVDRDEKK